MSSTATTSGEPRGGLALDQVGTASVDGGALDSSVRATGGAPRAAAVIAVSAWALSLFGVVLLVAARPPVTSDLLFFVVDVTVGCVYGTVAGVTLSRRRHPVPWILAVTAVGGGVAGFGFAYAVLAHVRHGMPLVDVVGRLNGIAWVPGTFALFLVIPWMVRDQRLGARGWAGVLAGCGFCLLFTVVRVFDLTWFSTEQMTPAAVVLGLAAAADSLWRWRRGPVDERAGLGWLTWGTAIMALSFVPLAVPDHGQLPLWFTPGLHLCAQAFFPAAILVAVLRQRLWGIDLAVSRALVAGLLTVVLVLVYVVVTTLVTRLLPGDGLAQVVAAAAVAAAVQPSRLWVQTRVHRLVHGEAAQPDRAVRRLGTHLGAAGSPDELLSGLVENLGVALRLESVRLLVAGEEVAVWGHPTGALTPVPLVHRGADVGRLEVTTPPGESLGSRSTRSLRELAAVVAAGVALAQASRDLDDARDRLTTVRLEERRVLRRELHDGLGPSLAGIRLGLQGARNLVAQDPVAAEALLAQLQAELDHRVDDIRALSRSLLPPVLDELGLAAALHDLASRQSQSGLDVVVHCDSPVDLDQRIAQAAYGIVVEAVTNVVRHSGGRTCRVAVTTSDVLDVLVEDDGAGISPTARSGVGTQSMRERAEEQGGTFLIESLEGSGTRVHATLPLVRHGDAVEHR